MTDQIDEIYYRVNCDTCGKTIMNTLLARDLEYGSALVKMTHDVLIKHNTTHYESPTVYACTEDDVFGVLHTHCTHRS